MNTERLEALLWARVDNTIEPEELAELEAHLAENVAAQETEKQIRRIAQGFDQLEHVQPPPELRGRIDEALSRAEPPARGPIPFDPARAGSPRSMPWLPIAASLLIGVSIGYLMHPVTGGSIDRSEVTGSMLTPTSLTETAPVEILLGTGTGSVVASRAGTDIVVDLTTSVPADLRVTLAGTLGPMRLAGLTTEAALAAQVSTGQGWVVVQVLGTGRLSLTSTASQADEVVRLQVSSNDGASIEEHWLGPSTMEPEP